MKAFLLHHRFNYLDTLVACGCGAIMGNGYLLLGIGAWLAGHVIVSAIEAFSS